MTFAHFRRAGNRALKGFLTILGMVRQPNRNICGKSRAQLGPVDDRPVSGNDPGPLHLLHPAQAGRWRQARPFGKHQIADPAIPGQLPQYPFVDCVYLGHLLRSLADFQRIRNPNAPITA